MISRSTTWSAGTGLDLRSDLSQLGNLVEWVIILDANATAWTINCQPDGFDSERSIDVKDLGPVVLHAPIAADDSFFAALFTANSSR